MLNISIENKKFLKTVGKFYSPFKSFKKIIILIKQNNHSHLEI